MCRGASRHAGITEAISKALRHDYQSPYISFRQRVMPSREIDIRISQEYGIHTDFHWKIDPRVSPVKLGASISQGKPEDDYIKTNCRTNETASYVFEFDLSLVTGHLSLYQRSGNRTRNRNDSAEQFTNS